MIEDVEAALEREQKAEQAGRQGEGEKGETFGPLFEQELEALRIGRRLLDPLAQPALRARTRALRCSEKDAVETLFSLLLFGRSHPMDDAVGAGDRLAVVVVERDDDRPADADEKDEEQHD